MQQDDWRLVRQGAHNAVCVCMGVRSEDSVFVIADEASLGIARLLAEEAALITPEVRLRLLEEYAPRPILSLPEGLREDLLASQPTVTFFTASGQPGEITFRLGMGVFLRNDLRVRHAHMIGITPELMQSGMLADYDLVWYVTHYVYEEARLARHISVTSHDGTDLEADFEPWLRWVPCDGRYHRTGAWGNLPEGETYTCPSRVNGVLVAHVLGDYLSERYGVLAHPVRVEIRDSMVTHVACAQPGIAQELERYLDGAQNGRRVGEFAIGTNVALTQLVGNLLQDEKVPGVHLAFGHPYPEETGARWASAVHVDAVAPFCTVDVNGRRLLEEGRFLGLPPDMAATLYGS